MKISLIGFGVLFAAALCGRAAAAETTYGVGAHALPLQQEGGTARAMGMGSAVVGVGQDSASLLWNPAGLSRMDAKEIGIHHNSGLGDLVQEIFVFGAPLGKVTEGKGGSLGGIAASFGFVNYGSFAGADSAGQATGGYTSGDFSGSIGYGKQFLPGLSGGVALKGNQSNFASKVYSTYSTDVGLLWKVVPSLDLGLTYSNLKMFGGRIGDQASGLRLGAGWSVDKHWLLAASTELQSKAMKRLQLGTEYLIGDVDKKSNVLALRGGYQFSIPNRELGALAGLSWGLGYTITRSIAVDYAMLPTGDLGISHRVSLTFKFNTAKEEKAAETAAATAPKAVPVVAAAAPIAASRKKEPVVLKSIVLEKSHFDFDKFALRPQGMEALKDNVQLLKDNPKANVRVAGYTSMRGKAEYNQGLSERRAGAVRDYLVAQGIASDRITVIGYGETRPAAYEASPKKVDQGSDAAKDNMRVLFEITVD